MIEKLKETGIYFIGTVGVAIFSFIISILYTRMFSTDDYGIYSLIAAFYNLIYQLLTGWMTHSILRYYPEEQKRDGSYIFRNTMLRIHIILSFIFFLLIIIAIIFYKQSLIVCTLLLIYLGVFVFEGLLLIFNTFLRAEGKSRQYSINTIFNSVVKSLSIIILFYLFKFTSIKVIVFSIFISEFLLCLYVYFRYKWYKIIKKNCFDINLARRVLIFGYPLIGVSVIFNILTYSDRYIIGFFGTNSDVGLYSYGYNMGYTLFYTLTNAIMLGAYPRITKEWNDNGRKSAERSVTNYLNLYFYLMIPCVFGILAIGNKIIYCLCGSAYWNSSNVFIITCVSYTLYGLLQYTNKAWELTAKTKIILNLNIVAAILNIVLNILLIPQYGYVIAAYTTMFSFLIYIILSLYLSKDIFNFIIDRITFFKILFASVGMFILIKLFDNYMNNSLLNICLEIFVGIVFYFFILIIFRDKNVSMIIKKIKESHL